MKKFFFNEEGLLELQQTLYALDDVQLRAEVSAMEADFSNWILLHFNLNEGQQTFFKKMDTAILNFLASQSSFAVANRLPVSLDRAQGNVALTGGEEGDKLFEPKSKLQASTDQEGNFQAGGSLVLSVSYS